MAEPTITFGAAASFGAQTGWNENSSGVNVASDRGVSLDEIGNEAASQLHNERTEVSTNYASAATAAPTIPATLGAIVNSLVLTGISVQTSGTGFATMTLTGHNHTDNAHGASPALASVAHGISISAGWGGEDFLGGTAGDNAAVESSSLDITCEHTDVTGATGNHLVGDNHGPKISATTVWNGAPASPVGEGWDKVSVATETTNQGFLKTTVTAEKSLAFS